MLRIGIILIKIKQSTKPINKTKPNPQRGAVAVNFNYFQAISGISHIFKKYPGKMMSNANRKQYSTAVRK
jgi:hypothetical protein